MVLFILKIFAFSSYQEVEGELDGSHICQVTIRKLSEIGIGPTKQEAKFAAARKYIFDRRYMIYHKV